jgi:hypothetical protein
MNLKSHLAWPSHQSPLTRAALAFLALYLVLIQTCRILFSHDPTSLFFQSAVASRQRYSAQRRAQAERFIAGPASHAPQTKAALNGTTTRPSMCVGIATIAREGARYFRGAVGSLLEGLDERERQEIYLVVFVAHTDPSVHPAHGEAWVRNVADQVLAYDLPEKDMQHLKDMEKEGGMYWEKQLFDYTYLLKACAAVEADYVLMLEDDVLALDGWYHRARLALIDAESQASRVPDEDSTCLLDPP